MQTLDPRFTVHTLRKILSLCTSRLQKEPMCKVFRISGLGCALNFQSVSSFIHLDDPTWIAKYFSRTSGILDHLS